MIIISYGITKSGSTLAFEMAKAALELAGEPQEMLPPAVVDPVWEINLIDAWDEPLMERLLDATAGRRVVLKTHAHAVGLDFDRLRQRIDAGDVRIHVIYRDPREMLISMLDHGVKARAGTDEAFRDTYTLEDAIRRLGVQLYWFRSWGTLPSLKLRYQDFAFDPVVGPKTIADDLGVDVAPERIWEVVNTRFTQKNEARPDRYKSDLWPDELARIEAAFPLYLELVRGNDLGWFAPTD